ncbi:Uncharacterized membrane protein YgaE, UPF0421/DUF939 family [Thermoactinomyces sp. DSM 45892]|nr:Uncharacterized membrane protein YgaE, UPF0421/DUF939 family [Thermoactinomyces sp. DSM 45892]
MIVYYREIGYIRIITIEVKKVFKIGYRTIKSAVGAGVAIAIAQFLQLDFYAGAGIITILCIKQTRKSSYETAWERFLTSVIGLMISWLMFENFGYHPWTITLLLLITFPIMVGLKAKEGIPAASVIISHLYTLQHIDWHVMVNELGIIVIGILVAFIVNSYMPSSEKKLLESQRKIEQNFKRIFREMAIYLRYGESNWDGKELMETAEWIKEAKEMALHNIENHSAEEEKAMHRYFQMREKQFEIMERIMPTVSMLNHTCDQSQQIAIFLEELADAIHPGNTADIYLERLEQMKREFREQPLPVDRIEFETRACLYFFVGEMKRYLIIKKALTQKKSTPDSSNNSSTKKMDPSPN